MNAYLQEIGERVRSARLAKHLSQAELAEKLDVTPTYISNLEQGKNTMSILVFQKITEALNVSADWLLRANTPELAQISDAEIICIMTTMLNLSRFRCSRLPLVMAPPRRPGIRRKMRRNMTQASIMTVTKWYGESTLLIRWSRVSLSLTARLGSIKLALESFLVLNTFRCLLIGGTGNWSYVHPLMT